MLTLLADTTFNFSVGAVLALGTVAVGYGILKHEVKQLRLDLLRVEQEKREENKDTDGRLKETDNRLRDLERWQDRTKGAERARDNRHSDSSHTQTLTRPFTKRDKE